MKSFRVILTLAVLLTAAGLRNSATAQVKVNWSGELNYAAADGKYKPQMNIYATVHTNGPWGAFFWNLLERDYGETYVGPLYAPAPWVELGAGYGFEQNSPSERYAGQAWLGTGRYSLLAITEEGGSGFWYKAKAMYQFDPRVAAGVLSYRFKGTGPEVDVSAAHRIFWIAPLWNTEEKGRYMTFFGAKAVF